MTKPKKITEGVDALSEILGLSSEEADDSESHRDQRIRELYNIVSFKITDLLDEHGRLKPLVDQPEYVPKAIADLKVNLRGTGKYDADGVPIIEITYGITLPDKLELLHELGLLVGAFDK